VSTAKIKRVVKSVLNYTSYLRDFKKFKKALSSKKRFSMNWKNRRPCLHDKTSKTYFDRHYVYHTGWAARALKKINPKQHIDISSSLYFVSIASAFVPMKFYDYRPAKLELSNLSSDHADLYKLPFKTGSVESISCMHVVEHIGLGRYGDPIDPDGDVNAMRELERVVAPGGSLLLVVPVGKPQIMFNAHRVYSYKQIAKNFPSLSLKEFALIPEREENGEIMYNPSPELVDKERYACGCFWLKRRDERLNFKTPALGSEGFNPPSPRLRWAGRLRAGLQHTARALCFSIRSS